MTGTILRICYSVATVIKASDMPTEPVALPRQYVIGACRFCGGRRALWFGPYLCLLQYLRTFNKIRLSGLYSVITYCFIY